MGGGLARMPSGIINAILVNLGAVLIIKTSVHLRVRNWQRQLCLQLVAIFLITYFNMGLMILKRY